MSKRFSSKVYYNQIWAKTFKMKYREASRDPHNIASYILFQNKQVPKTQKAIEKHIAEYAMNMGHPKKKISIGYKALTMEKAKPSTTHIPKLIPLETVPPIEELTYLEKKMMKAETSRAKPIKELTYLEKEMMKAEKSRAKKMQLSKKKQTIESKPVSKIPIKLKAIPPVSNKPYLSPKKQKQLKELLLVNLPIAPIGSTGFTPRPESVSMMNDQIIIVFDFDNTIVASNFGLFIAKPENYIKYFWNSAHVGQINIGKYTTKQLLNVSKRFRQSLSTGDYSPSKIDRDILIDVFWGGESRLKYMYAFFKKLAQLFVDIHISSNTNCQIIVNFLELFHFDEFFRTTTKLDPITKKITYHIDYDKINAKRGPCVQADKSKYIYDLYKDRPSILYYIDDDPTTNDKIIELGKKDISEDYFGTLHPETYRYFGKNIGLKFQGKGLNQKMINIILDHINHFLGPKLKKRT